MTQPEFAAKVGFSMRQIKGWEHPLSPRGTPKLESAEKLAKVFDDRYPPELFMVEEPLDEGIALRIERKLDLIMAHLGIED